MPRQCPLHFARRLTGLTILLSLLVLATARAQSTDPYGDCCVSQVTMTSFDTWEVVCGSCANNPGTYALRQPDPEKLVFVGPNGETAGSRYEAAAAVCRCPSQQVRKNREKTLRTFEGN